MKSVSKRSLGKSMSLDSFTVLPGLRLHFLDESQQPLGKQGQLPVKALTTEHLRAVALQMELHHGFEGGFGGALGFHARS